MAGKDSILTRRLWFYKAVCLTCGQDSACATERYMLLFNQSHPISSASNHDWFLATYSEARLKERTSNEARE